MRLIRLHVRLERRAEVAERREMVRLEERVSRSRQRDFLTAVTKVMRCVEMSNKRERDEP